MKDIIAKVNYYSALAKKRTLTDEETIERQKYRTLYLEQFKSQVKGHLDQVKVVDQNGNEVKLNKKVTKLS
ncbi:DUF896 domain-containing protein [Psychrilyobacter piezotolerans]|uniref:DUF896 domain-containing protein n=2 Tax=Fusobacteriaceae TaxID=203492 RepID=A0ABX9KE75_9FUSO|nr:DUF896 domain-containing protein [Psychrilyobacter piezotolerans]RDE59459.1 DUF896 domain-containing protein [Psychrilyobacter sp. S5]REI39929.1 DUF896 domain-containing protein [Psychrilyobacter piezotolerans]